MKICIIDDEKNNRDLLAYLIHQIEPGATILGEADSVQEGLRLISRVKPNLLFLDIQMPDGSGFDLIEQLTDCHPEIIFCTAYNQFALKAIECSALAYILKPVIKETVANALSKAGQRIQNNNRLLQYDVLAEQLKNQSGVRERFLLHTSDKMHIIYIDELICCVAHSNYTDIHLEQNRRITVAKTMKEMESILSHYLHFKRIHQSNLINTQKIKDLVKADNNLYIELQNGMILGVSRNKRNEVMAMFK